MSDLGPDAGGTDSHDEAADEAGGRAAVVLEYLAKEIVDNPDAVSIEASPTRSGQRLSLTVDPSDMGKVIGRKGRIAQSIRSVVRAAGTKDGADVSVDIVD